MLGPLFYPTKPSQAVPWQQQMASETDGSVLPSGPEIIDIRHAPVQADLKESIISMLKAPDGGPPQLPTMLLYDQRGLQLFEAITYLDEYYLTPSEVQLLEENAFGIADKIPSGAMVVELGSGNLRKVKLILQALEDRGKAVDYYALDLSRSELERTLAQLPSYRHVACRGLWGTYDDGKEWLSQQEMAGRRKIVLHMGSSIGNFDRDGAVQFLTGFASVLREGDAMMVGVDGCEDGGKVYHAYNDQIGLTHRFILNGLEHANRILGQEVFKKGEWKVIGEFVHDEAGARHQAFLSPVRDVDVLGIPLKPHDRIKIEQSLKYSARERKWLWEQSGLEQTTCWLTKGGEYGLFFVEKPAQLFSLDPKAYVATTLPTLDEWKALWAAWDKASTQMLPIKALLDKPINLRNAFVFYLGHIPNFLDVQLTKATGLPPSEPASYSEIFERGIDPDVENPSLCHEHSHIPEEWPPVQDIIKYRDAVRARLANTYQAAELNRKVQRGIWVAFEHEAMHLETLLYMLLQCPMAIPPTPSDRAPDFELMAGASRLKQVDNQWHRVPSQSVVVGMDDPEGEGDRQGHFGWDNEKPTRKINVPEFEIKGRPITNEEYALYMEANGIDELPASWTRPAKPSSPSSGSNGLFGKIQDSFATVKNLSASFLEDKSVKTVYGPVPLKHALDWPVSASYNEIAGCASWMGGRIPTAEEVQSSYVHAERYRTKKKEVEKKLGRTKPAVNGHLVANGVEETPPSPLSPSDGSLFVDLEGANVGFKRWHPTPVTADGDRLCGRGEMGGVWEWTSSTLDKHEGFQPMALYPGYTADFFDGKHNMVLGGSWATHPRIAGRRSFVNWYQRSYPYVWAGARLARGGERN